LFVGLDVSQKMTAICVIDNARRRLWRVVRYSRHASGFEAVEQRGALPGKVFFRIELPIDLSNVHSEDACLVVLCGHHVRAEPSRELPPHVFHEIPRADAEAPRDCLGRGELCEDDGAPEWWGGTVSTFPTARWSPLVLRVAAPRAG
jgi:hypothetical protein